MFMICIAGFTAGWWHALQIYDDKKRFIYLNLAFLTVNIFGCGITVCGNSIWSDILLAVMIILVILLMYIVLVKKYRYKGK